MHKLTVYLFVLILTIIVTNGQQYTVLTQNVVASAGDVGKYTYDHMTSMAATNPSNQVGVVSITNNSPMLLVLTGGNIEPTLGQPTISSGSSGMYSWLGLTDNTFIACMRFDVYEKGYAKGDTLTLCFSQLVAGQTRTRIWWNAVGSTYPPVSSPGYDTTNTISQYYPYDITAHNIYTCRIDVFQKKPSTASMFYWVMTISDMSQRDTDQC